MSGRAGHRVPAHVGREDERAEEHHVEDEEERVLAPGDQEGQPAPASAQWNAR